jgi:hypothetical protein
MRLLLLIAGLALSLGYHFVASWYPDVSWLASALMSWVWPAFLFIILLVTILLTGLRGKGDPVQRAWGALAIAGCLLLVPLIIAREHQAKVDKEAESLVQENREALRLAQQRRNQQIREVELDRQKRAKDDRFVQYEGRIPSQMIQAMRELDKRMLDDVQSHAKAYQEALNDNPTTGPDDWVQFRTLDQVEVELSAHKALYEKTRAFNQFIESFEDTYSAAIEAMNLQSPADRVAIAELQRILQEWKRSRLYELRRLDVKLLGSTIRALSILSDQWGRWEYLPREQRVQFEDPRQQAGFEEAVLTASAIIEEVQMISQDSGQNVP